MGTLTLLTYLINLVDGVLLVCHVRTHVTTTKMAGNATKANRKSAVRSAAKKNMTDTPRNQTKRGNQAAVNESNNQQPSTHLDNKHDSTALQHKQKTTTQQEHTTQQKNNRAEQASTSQRASTAHTAQQYVYERQMTITMAMLSGCVLVAWTPMIINTVLINEGSCSSFSHIYHHTFTLQIAIYSNSLHLFDI